MTLTRLLGLLSASLALASILVIAGGLAWSPPVPRCKGCAVLTHAWGGCREAVVGGYVCG